MLIYTDESIINVSNIKNLLSNAGIETVIRNEFASGAAGDLSPFETWPQLWLVNEKDKSKASPIVEQATERQNGVDWICNKCQEINASTFDFCWNCGEENE